MQNIDEFQKILDELQGMKRMIYSFSDALAIAIGKTTPYNANHAESVTMYMDKFALTINKLHDEGKCEYSFSQDELEQIHLAAALHDIGKLVTPLEVMNKRSRLDGYMESIKTRFTIVDQRITIDELSSHITTEKAQKLHHFIREAYAFIESRNNAEPFSSDVEEYVNQIYNFDYMSSDNKKYILITAHERDCLLIKYGTLTDNERTSMQEHVVMTESILSKVYFPSVYSRVMEIASMHHEALNGTGYPRALKGDDIPVEARMLAIADVYDALTASDRPYKDPVPRYEALRTLYELAYEGRLDKKLVKIFEEATR